MSSQLYLKIAATSGYLVYCTYQLTRPKKEVLAMPEAIIKELLKEKKIFRLHIDWVAVIIASVLALLIKVGIITKVPW
jgi:hypothetical protein